LIIGQFAPLLIITELKALFRTYNLPCNVIVTLYSVLYNIVNVYRCSVLLTFLNT